MVVVAARIFSSFSDEDTFNLAFRFTPISLVNGFAMGFLIAFVTVALTSIRISRVNIIAAIRDLPNEGGRRLKRRWVALSTVAAAGFGALSTVAIANSQGVGVYLYPALAVLALCPLLVRLAPKRWVYSGASLATLAWGLAANTLRPKVFDDGSTATFIVLGSLLTFSAVLLVSQNQQLLMRPLRPLINRPTLGGLATRLAVAYPIARRFRTGAILIMYGLVVFTLVLITVLGNLIGAGTDTEVANASGGFGVRADFNPSAPVGDPARTFTSGRFAGKVDAVAPLTVSGAKVTNLIKGRTDPHRRHRGRCRPDAVPGRPVPAQPAPRAARRRPRGLAGGPVRPRLRDPGQLPRPGGRRPRVDHLPARRHPDRHRPGHRQGRIQDHRRHAQVGPRLLRRRQHRVRRPDHHGPAGRPGPVRAGRQAGQRHGQAGRRRHRPESWPPSCRASTYPRAWSPPRSATRWSTAWPPTAASSS